MTPREKAIEAAAKAICNNVCNTLGSRGAENQAAMAGFRKDATSAIDAYLAALEAEGGAKRGNCMIWPEGKDNECWACDTVPSDNPKHIPVLIIKE
jgi:hypothetical protein